MKLKYEAIVMGASAGGLNAFTTILGHFSDSFPIPVIAVLHRSRDTKSMLEEVLQNTCKLIVKQADEKERPLPGIVYFAPPGYHLLIEKDRTFSLSVENYLYTSIPSIDILFETAADAYNEKLIGVILTGSNKDGAMGAKRISQNGGLVIVQDPKFSEYPEMPQAAIAMNKSHTILNLKGITSFLMKQANLKK